MNFEERVTNIYNSILHLNLNISQQRIDKNQTLILNMVHSFKYKKFQEDIITSNQIQNFLCYVLVNKLIDVSDIYILNAFISNLSIYKINIIYLKENFSIISYAPNNCEKNSKIISNNN